MAELTEMAGVAEAETQAAYAWALDYDDVDEFPTQRLTSRRITTLSLAASLILIAVAGVVALTLVRQPELAPVPAPVVETVARPTPPPTVTAAPSPPPPPINLMFPEGRYVLTNEAGQKGIVTVKSCGSNCRQLGMGFGDRDHTHTVYLQGDAWEGTEEDSGAVRCGGVQAPLSAAQVHYTLSKDGSSGSTKIIGQPCPTPTDWQTNLFILEPETK